ncbi:MAG: phosphatidate cytidylyltransferase [Gammaproteobacteria bacterium]|jgi:phosphatidate cytidylyltransferase|nr:phosphatidate cytidylyltransferase [Gammaproteobacteria bacterium]|tara:strand:+ start:1887 stop:2750 length:864 start_codon:yes stop_codon:yes gene_type:complete
MLKQRIITAISLVIGLIAATTQLSLFNFTLFISLVVVLASWEWSGFIGLNESSAKLTYSLTIAAMIIGLYFILDISTRDSSIDFVRASILLGLGLLFWMLMVFVLAGYPENKSAWNNESKIACMGMLVLIPSWVGLVVLKSLEEAGLLVLALVILVAAVDIGAYFAGVNFGSRKLAPNLSPKKTWEGVWGGFALCAVISVAMIWAANSYFLDLTSAQMVVLFFLAPLTTFFSVIGDLLESMLKRNQNIKDSGRLLPGHGGILDRIDGLVATAPPFVLLLVFMMSEAS